MMVSDEQADVQSERKVASRAKTSPSSRRRRDRQAIDHSSFDNIVIATLSRVSHAGVVAVLRRYVREASVAS